MTPGVSSSKVTHPCLYLCLLIDLWGKNSIPLIEKQLKCLMNATLLYREEWVFYKYKINKLQNKTQFQKTKYFEWFQQVYEV